MFDATPYLEQLDEQEKPVSIEIRERMHRLETDYGLRNDIRKDMIDALKRMFSAEHAKSV